MGVQVNRGWVAAFLVLLLSTSLCRASSVTSSGYFRCNDTIAGCLEEEVEFLMDSEVSRRILQAGGNSPTQKAVINAGNAVCRGQPGTPKYMCVPPRTGMRVIRCATYDRCRMRPPP